MAVSLTRLKTKLKQILPIKYRNKLRSRPTCVTGTSTNANANFNGGYIPSIQAVIAIMLAIIIVGDAIIALQRKHP